MAQDRDQLEPVSDAVRRNQPSALRVLSVSWAGWGCVNCPVYLKFTCVTRAIRKMLGELKLCLTYYNLCLWKAPTERDHRIKIRLSRSVTPPSWCPINYCREHEEATGRLWTSQWRWLEADATWTWALEERGRALILAASNRGSGGQQPLSINMSLWG